MAVKFEPNRQGLIEVMRSGSVQGEVSRQASRIARTAGDSAGAPGGYTVSTMQGRARFRAIVYADSIKAKRREASGNHLLRSLG
jgi:hypothetical protein